MTPNEQSVTSFVPPASSTAAHTDQIPSNKKLTSDRQIELEILNIDQNLSSATRKRMSDEELLQIVEWMVPQEFQSKFYKKGYIPSDHDRKSFIHESEILKRSQE